MITEDYVSFETAKLLKEKGFPQYKREDGFVGLKYNMDGELTTAPYAEHYRVITQAMAMKWLREVHKLGVFPTTFYRYLSKDKDIHNYGSTIVNLNTFEIIGDKTPPINGGTYTFEADTYEETAEKAIRYCLENLI